MMSLLGWSFSEDKIYSRGEAVLLHRWNWVAHFVCHGSLGGIFQVKHFHFLTIQNVSDIKFSFSYSLNSCTLESSLQSLSRECGCIPTFYHSDNLNVPACTKEKSSCVEKYNGEGNTGYTFKDWNIRTKTSWGTLGHWHFSYVVDRGVKKHCLTRCNDVEMVHQQESS